MKKLLQKLNFKKIDYLLLTILICFISLIFFLKISSSYRLPFSYNYDSDFGRDLLRMFEILHGNITLIGPQLSFAGLHMAPYYFYIFAPFLLLSGFDHRILFYVNSLFFLIGFILMFLVFRKEWGRRYSFLSTLFLVTTPYIILAARSPGNAFGYLILFIFVTTILFYKNKISKKLHFVIGMFEGLIINFHPINIFIIIPMHLGRIIFLDREPLRRKIKASVLAILGMGIMFSPIALFEFKHGFVITKNLLNPNYYLSFFGSSKFGFSTLIQNFVDLNVATLNLIPLSILGLLFLNCVLFFKIKRNRKPTLVLTITFLNILFLALMRQGAFHYFLPTLLLLQMALIIQINEFRFKKMIISVLIGINILFFPTYLYQPARNLTYLENDFIKIDRINFLPHKDLNVILINETYLSKVGYEYRYLLKKYNYSIDDEYSYKKSKYLVVIDEQSMTKEIMKESSWEFEQFGNKKLLHINKVNNTTFFLFEKTSR